MTVAVLLLALGVGFMIGNSGNSGAKQPPVNVTVRGDVGGGSGASSSGTATPTANSGSSGSSGKNSKGTGSTKSSKSSTASTKTTPVKTHTASSSSSAGQAAANSGSALSSLAGESSKHESKKTATKNVKKALGTAVKTPSGKVLPPADEQIGESCPANMVGCVNGTYQGTQL